MASFCFLLLALYFGVSVYLLCVVKDKAGHSYPLRHPFGALMILLFGPLAAGILLLFPKARQAVRGAKNF